MSGPLNRGYPQEHTAPAGSSDAGDTYGYRRWNEADCRGRIQAVYVRVGSSSKWTRVGSLCVRCAVYWPDVPVLESIDPIKNTWYLVDSAAGDIRRLGAVDRRPVTVPDGHPEPSTDGRSSSEPSTDDVDELGDAIAAALPDVDDLLEADAVDGSSSDRLQPAAGDEPSTAEDPDPSTAAAIATTVDGAPRPRATVDARATSPDRNGLPRGTCPDCGRDVAIRRNGVTREHRVYRAQADQDPLEHLGRTTLCPGSGRLPVLEGAPS